MIGPLPLASCPECGQVVIVAAVTPEPWLRDPHAKEARDIDASLGQLWPFTQGCGPRDGRRHRCPFQDSKQVKEIA